MTEKLKILPLESDSGNGRIRTSNQLVRKYGHDVAVQIILNEVNNGNPPIVGIRGGVAQLELKFL